MIKEQFKRLLPNPFAVDYQATNGPLDLYTEAEMEKFANLLLKECLEVLRLVPYSSDREFGDESIYQDAILQHFGIVDE